MDHSFINHPILLIEYDQLNISAEFRLMMERNGFKNLRELFEVVEPQNLTAIPLANYRVYKELIALLDSHDLGGMMK
jgi:hypothetical protein